MYVHAHTRKSCHTHAHARIMSRMKESCPVLTSHVQFERVMSSLNESCPISRVNEPCHKHCDRRYGEKKNSATHCNTLQHTATHCNTHCKTHIAAHCNEPQHTATHMTRRHYYVKSGMNESCHIRTSHVSVRLYPLPYLR